MSYTFNSNDYLLAGHLAIPNRIGVTGTPGLILCHGFPTVSSKEITADHSYYDFADLVSKALGWIVLAFTYRGCGTSEGQFSLQGWLDDTVNAAKDLNLNSKVNSIWLAGFGTGGALALTAASQCEEIDGVAAISAPSDFHDWGQDPDQLLDYSRVVGAISDPEFPKDRNSWVTEIGSIDPLKAAEGMSDKPLLVVHGASDQVVPSFDARVIADAHGSADLRIIDGGTHRLRFDPRAMAIIIGWLDRAHRLQTRNNTPSSHSMPKGK